MTPAARPTAMSAPNRAVNVVVTCSDRKRARLGDPVRMQDLPRGTIEQRCRRWCALLRERPPSAAAVDLYVGEHWSVARSIPSVAAGLDIDARLWVCSAGYGLLPGDARIVPYAATFASGHADSVRAGVLDASDGDVESRWWAACGRWNGRGVLADLASREPDTPLVVALSATYLRAVADDLVAAKANLSDPDLLTLVAVGVDRAPRGLEENLLPATADLSTATGGTLGSLNARLAVAALERSRGRPIRASRLRDRFREWLDATPRRTIPARRTMDDEAVRSFIRRHRDIADSHTAMLRLLRDQGFACEQSRFRELFLATTGGGN